MSWGSPVERERRNRIIVAVAAYAYEVHNDPIMSDAEFDELASAINPSRPTGNTLLDDFYRRCFDPSTGMWVHRHPALAGIKGIYDRHWRK